MTATVSQHRPRTTADGLAAAFAGGPRLLTGQYRVDLETGRWWWSDEVYLLHGYEPGAVEPSLDVILERQHPDERDRTRRDAKRTLATGGPFAGAHRIVDAAGRCRTLLVTGQPRRPRDDQAGDRHTEIVGYVVDVTPVQRAALDREARHAIDSAFVSAADIERAKGVLMATHSVDVDTAEHLLAEAAGATGAGLRDTAAQVMERLVGDGGLGRTAEDRLRHALDAVEPRKRPHGNDAQLARRRPAA